MAAPLPEASRFNLNAPLLTIEPVAEIKASAAAKANLRLSRDGMLDFYRRTIIGSPPSTTITCE